MPASDTRLSGALPRFELDVRDRASSNLHSKSHASLHPSVRNGDHAPAACSNRCRRGGGASRSVVAETALIAMFDPRRPEVSLAPRKMGEGTA